ncbi:transcriptional regulator [Streptomyces sp. NPDC001393]
MLREAGVIRVRVDGSRRMLSLRRAELNSCFPGLLDSILNAAPELLGAR